MGKLRGGGKKRLSKQVTCSTFTNISADHKTHRHTPKTAGLIFSKQQNPYYLWALFFLNVPPVFKSSKFLRKEGPLPITLIFRFFVKTKDCLKSDSVRCRNNFELNYTT